MWERLIQRYEASITFADAELGRVIDALDASPIAMNTIIVVQGMHFGEKENWEKFTLWERSTRLPLVIAAPGGSRAGTRAGTRVTSPASLVELYDHMADPDALNDVGWEIYRGNYEHFLEQIDPAATSVGLWRVGPKDQPFGRYARGFEHATGKAALFYRFDPRFLTSGADRRAEVRVVYFDGGSGRWALRYHASDGTMKQAAEVQKKNTGRWQEIIVPIDGASFGGQGPRGCDLQLQNPDTEDDIFHLVEVRRQ